MSTYDYCVKCLPLDHPFYKSCALANSDDRDSVSSTDVENVISSFGRLHAKFIEDPSILNTIEEEISYQSFTREQISSDILKKAEVSDGSYRMNVVWGFLRTALPNLSQIAMVLVIPHSNAGEERIFSIVRKNKTKFRSRLELRRSLNSIMIVKSAIPERLVETDPRSIEEM